MNTQLENFYLPTEYASKLFEGSYEEHRQQMEEALESKVSELLDDEAGEYYVLHTFKNHAHIATTEGKLFRIAFSSGKQGMRVKTIEQIDAPITPARDMHETVSKELDGVVDAFFSGDKEAAVNSFKSVAGLIDESLVREGVDSVRRFVDRVFGEQSWRAQVREKREAFGAAIKIEESGESVKFEAVYSGETFEEEYTDELFQSIIDGTEGIVSATSKMYDEALSMFNTYAERYRGTDMEEQTADRSAVEQEFEKFASVFLHDVGRALSETNKMLEANDCAACWAMIHDGWASASDDVRVGCGLVAHFSQVL